MPEPTKPPERKFVDVSGHELTDISWEDREGPSGICPVYKHRVYGREVL